MDIYGQHPMMQQQAQPQFRIVKSMMVESGTYNQEFTRPYVGSTDSDVVSLYREQTHNGRQVDRNTLAGIAGRIVAPSAVPDAQVSVANGWGIRRIIFMMEIIELNSRLTTVIMGYADKVDLSLGGLIDPHLRMTINSSITLNTVEYDTPTGPQIRKRVVENSHLLGIQTMNSLTSLDPNYNTDGPRVYMQRPTDIANNLSLGHMNAGIIGDGRTQVVPNKQTRSRRANNSAPVFLSEVVNGIVQTAQAPELSGSHISAQEVYSQAGAVMGESNIHSDPTLRYINQNSNIRNEGFVTWGNMCHIFPDLDRVTEYYKHSDSVQPMASHFESTHGSFEYWDRVSWEALMATTVFHTMPSIISQSMLIGITGTMTNVTAEGLPMVNITNAHSFIDGFDRTAAVQQVEHRILTELFPGLSLGNQRTIFIAFNINLIRDGWVSISIDGGAAIEYSSPCFADGLLLPTLATNEHSLSNLAGHINTLVMVSQE